MVIRLSQTPTFRRWLERLKDTQARAAIVLRLRHVQAGHLGDARNLGHGLHELRWHIGPGYRVYFSRQGDAWILLLAGGDKSTQARDIQKARQLAREHGHGQDH